MIKSFTPVHNRDETAAAFFFPAVGEYVEEDGGRRAQDIANGLGTYVMAMDRIGAAEDEFNPQLEKDIYYKYIETVRQPVLAALEELADKGKERVMLCGISGGATMALAASIAINTSMQATKSPRQGALFAPELPAMNNLGLERGEVHYRQTMRTQQRVLRQDRKRDTPQIVEPTEYRLEGEAKDDRRLYQKRHLQIDLDHNNRLMASDQSRHDLRLAVQRLSDVHMYFPFSEYSLGLTEEQFNEFKPELEGIYTEGSGSFTMKRVLGTVHDSWMNPDLFVAEAELVFGAMLASGRAA